jgi:LacI family kdg operon repressor
MAAACEHLVGQGYREILYISEPSKGVSSRRERIAAFGDCTANQRLRVGATVFESAEEPSSVAELDAALLALKKRAGRSRRPAVLAGNAVVTLRVAAAVERLGWRFGVDLGFVGFDDTEWASLIGPGLSTIAQPTDEIGHAAASCLIERLQGLDAAPRQLLLPGKLVVRGSSQGAAG